MNNSYKGKILISTPDISGDIFSRSVVLIIEHDAHGAFGFILNKKNYFLSDNMKHLLGQEIDVYEGGPVENDRVFFWLKGNLSLLNIYQLMKISILQNSKKKLSLLW